MRGRGVKSEPARIRKQQNCHISSDRRIALSQLEENTSRVDHPRRQDEPRDGVQHPGVPVHAQGRGGGCEGAPAQDVPQTGEEADRREGPVGDALAVDDGVAGRRDAVHHERALHGERREDAGAPALPHGHDAVRRRGAGRRVGRRRQQEVALADALREHLHDASRRASPHGQQMRPRHRQLATRRRADRQELALLLQQGT